MVARHDDLPFGEEVPASVAGRDTHWGSTTDVDTKFTGQIRDTTTGQDYFNARYFGSTLGRFTSPDPAKAGADASDPQTLNGYAYVRNNPLNATDPTGMFLEANPTSSDPDFATSTDPYSLTSWIFVYNEQQYSWFGGSHGGGGGAQAPQPPPSQPPAPPQVAPPPPPQAPQPPPVFQPPAPPSVSTTAAFALPVLPQTPNEQPTVSHCLSVAAADKGLSIGLDILGAIPAVGNAASATAGAIRAGIAINHAITSPAFALSSGAYGACGAVTAGPEEATDSLVGASSAGASIGLTLADASLEGTKAIPIVGNFLSIATLGWDGYQAYNTYQSCMAGH